MKVSAAVLHSVCYVAALGAVLSLVFFGVTYGTASLMSRLAVPDQRSETKLTEGIANAREIRAALAKPIPQPEPLGPITHQAATERTVEPVETKPMPKPKLSIRARQAHASTRYQHSYQSYDRHRVY